MELSDSSSLLVATDYLPEELCSRLSLGRELESGEEEALQFAASCYRVEKAALRLVARAEQNSLGLKAKLERRFSDSSAVKAVVSSFLDKNLLDDRRYAEIWIRSRLSQRKVQSPRAMCASLGKRGIDKDTSEKALEKVLDQETEYTLLLKFLDKNAFPLKISLRTQLKYEGFSYSVIEMYLDSLS